jgi:hypothetical protein
MRQLFRRAWHAVRHRHFEAELAEEMAFTTRKSSRNSKAWGLKSSDASLATRRAFGSVALAQDSARDVAVAPGHFAGRSTRRTLALESHPKDSPR